MLSLASSLLVVLGFLTPLDSAFTISSSLPSSRVPHQKQLHSTKDSETEVEKLLRMARQLRQEAEQKEEEIHTQLLSKKEQGNAETDALIQQLFAADSLVDKLSERKCCTETLTRIVDRLFERECKAKGLEHIVPSLHHDHTQFKRIKTQVDKDELLQVTTMMDNLVEACEALDERFLEQQRARGEKYVTHLDREHWNAGNCAFHLKDHIRGLRREHEEQFQKRQEEFYKAQRKKDLPPPDLTDMNP